MTTPEQARVRAAFKTHRAEVGVDRFEADELIGRIRRLVRGRTGLRGGGKHPSKDEIIRAALRAYEAQLLREVAK